MFLISLALFLTFSRVAWLLAIIAWPYLLYMSRGKKEMFSLFKNKKNIFIITVLLVAIVAVVAFFASAVWWRVNPFLDTTWESLSVRWVVFAKTFELIRYHPFGVGAGSFIVQIAYLLTGYPIWMVEPAHNTFLMVFVEIGALGFISFSYIIYRTFLLLKKMPLFMKLVFISMFIYMFFDHGFWDIRQMQYLLVIIFGLIAVYSKDLVKDASVGS
jgi:O-antigen ligase